MAKMKEDHAAEVRRADVKTTKLVVDSLKMQESLLQQNHEKAFGALKREHEDKISEKQAITNKHVGKEDTHVRVRVQLRNENQALAARCQRLEAELVQNRERLAQGRRSAQRQNTVQT